MRPVVPFIVMRHGQTCLGAEGRFQGHSQANLDEIGKMQAATAANRLAQFLATMETRREYRIIFSSTLPRAVATARIVAKAIAETGLPVHETPALSEMSFGEWEGLTTHEVKERYPQQRRRRKADRWNFAAPGGESYADIAGRIEAWLAGLDEPAIMVAHSGTMRVMAHLLAGLTRDRAMAIEIGHCETWNWENGKFVKLGVLPSNQG